MLNVELLKLIVMEMYNHLKEITTWAISLNNYDSDYDSDSGITPLPSINVVDIDDGINLNIEISLRKHIIICYLRFKGGGRNMTLVTDWDLRDPVNTTRKITEDIIEAITEDIMEAIE